MSLTITQAEQQLETWLKANLAVAKGQSYTISTENDSRTLTRANAEEILKQVTFWDQKIRALKRGGMRIREGYC